MCDVHLIDGVNETRRARERLRCCSCGKPIKRGDPYRHVEGRLDDYSPGVWSYKAHEDCYWADRDDVHEDGCFTWTGAKKMSDDESKAQTALLLRCVGENVAGKCKAKIEVPFSSLHDRLTRADDGSLKNDPKDALAVFLFQNGDWHLSVVTKGREPVVMGPLCPKCAKKAYPGKLLEVARESLRKLIP